MDGVETLEEYVPGGFHPVLIGNILHDRYQIIDKLGYGGYSTIWLAHDRESKKHVAVKVGISDTDLPQSDVNILRKLSHPSIPKVLDRFDITGPNGTHPCYIMAPAQGSLADALHSPMFPIAVARVLAARLVQAVCYLHSQGFVHGDTQMRNVLVKTTSNLERLSIKQVWETHKEPCKIPISRRDGQPLTDNVPPYAVVSMDLGKPARKYTLDDARGLLLADFGESFSPATERRLGKDNHTPLAGRAPEAFFEPDTPLSYASDIWTMGTAIWEILGMKFIFSQHEPMGQLIAEHIDVLGYEGLPESWRKLWERQTDDGTEDLPRMPDREPDERWPPLEVAWEEFNQKWRRKLQGDHGTGVFDERGSEAVLELMRGMLRFRPKDRLTADQVLESKWMREWALPQLETSGR